MNSKVWFVVQENLVWQYCHDLDCNLWVTVSRKQITQVGLMKNLPIKTMRI